MFTIQRKTAKTGVASHFVGQIVLSDGTIAGEGYAQTEASAKRLATEDAMSSDNDRHVTAGKGHARLL